VSEWMIYGANGYTGELIAREAQARGWRPVLAGRNAAALARLGGSLGLPWRHFPVSRPELADLAGIGLVLNCAGPFSATAAAMMRACVAARAHYLDITGEIDVFEDAQTLSAVAREAGVVLCPGVGFDVVPTDCIALTLREAMPDATHLALGFQTNASMSPGSAKTAVEGLAVGGRVRRDGRIVTVPLGSPTRRIDFGAGETAAMALAWGDVSTAYHTTGIGNIEVFVAVPQAVIDRVRWLRALRPLLGLAPVQGALRRRAGRLPGPTTHARSASVSWVWGEVRNASGSIRTARVRTVNAYDLTVQASLAVTEFMLNGGNGQVGTLTPARLCGSGFVATLAGSSGPGSSGPGSSGPGSSGPGSSGPGSSGIVLSP